MVNIFGFKLFESPSIEEQMHHKSRRHHFKNRSQRRHHFKNRSRRHYRGGYTYDDANLAGEDLTATLSNSQSMSRGSKSSVNKKRKNGDKGKSSSTSKGRGTKSRMY